MHQMRTFASLQVQEEPESAIAAAAASLDSPEGPASFADFLSVILHPRSVVQVPLMGSSIIGGPTGFGGITSHADIAHQARHCCTVSVLTRNAVL
jgi:hypothetical protein